MVTPRSSALHVRFTSKWTASASVTAWAADAMSISSSNAAATTRARVITAADPRDIERLSNTGADEASTESGDIAEDRAHATLFARYGSSRSGAMGRRPSPHLSGYSGAVTLSVKLPALPNSPSTKM
jgi:hypothetical protein